MKVINLKAAKAARDRRRYADLVLKTYDSQEHEVKRQQQDKRSETQRKARNEL